MHPFLYALNIGTLATWLSVAGAGSIALVFGSGDPFSDGAKEQVAVPSKGSEVDINMEQLAAGSAAPSDPTLPSTEEQPVTEPSEQPEELEAIPELPDLVPAEPLPEIPNFPEPTRVEPSRDPKPAPSVKPSGPSRAASRSSDKPASGANAGAGTGKGSGSSSGSGSGVVGAARWAGGRMPAPNYPSEARRNGQQGRVVVLFSVDEQGNVVSASVTGPCPYPLLNEEALRAVRRWKFQPGARASLQRPIVFKLN